MERRCFELRADPEGRKLTGTAILYGDVATLPWGKERVEAGAFAPVGDVILNAQHQRGTPLARTAGGTLVLEDTAEALTIRADLPATRAADDVLALVRAGVLRGLSIEFLTMAERLEGNVRVIERASLFAVAVVDTAAYPASEIEARMKGVAVPVPRRRVWL